jgi:hypothetical protein
VNACEGQAVERRQRRQQHPGLLRDTPSDQSGPFSHAWTSRRRRTWSSSASHPEPSSRFRHVITLSMRVVHQVGESADHVGPDAPTGGAGGGAGSGPLNERGAVCRHADIALNAA